MDLYIIMQLLYQFGFIFLVTSFVILFSSKIKNSFFQSIISGFFLATELILIVLFQNHFGWQGLPNGRNFFVVFSILFWGPLASLPVVLSIIVISLFYPKLYIVQDLIVFCAVAILSLFYRWLIKKYSIKLKWYHIGLIAITPVVVSLILANILYPSESAVAEANKNVLLILGVYIIANYAIFYTNFREKDRQLHLKRIQEANNELEGQNQEIRALYEEMAASEEALHASFIELDQYKDTLEYIAYHDMKTSLFNYDYLNKQLRELDYEAKSNAVLIYIRPHDIEHLVDTLGQTLAEILYGIIAKMVSDSIRKYENYHLYHIAEGRFALMIENYEDTIFRNNIQEITDKLKNTQLVQNMILPVDLDIGGIQLGSVDDISFMLLESAEIAMIESSKEINRNTLVWFSQSMYDKKQYQTRLEFDLQHAIGRNELFLVLQPQYTKDMEMIGAEILLRWAHKEYGLISPSIFIPLAERIGLIGTIGRYVMTETINLIKKMSQHKVKQVPLSINTSLIELIDSNYSIHLSSLLIDHQIKSDQLNIEITESTIIQDMNHIKNNINKILDIGISLHLDDFGTGYSSLSHLSSLPISYIKIDKAFIDEILINDRSMQVVKTIIDLAHRLDMKVIAEGVESIEQLDSLALHLCDYYQGYYFSRPISIEDFFMLIKESDR